jgi:hypothetical protein
MIKISIIFTIAVLLLYLFIFTRLNKIILANFAGRMLYILTKLIRSIIKYTPEDKIVGLYPLVNKHILKKYGLNEDLIGIPMPIWKRMILGNRVISAEHGTNFFVIGKTNFWGMSSFLNPDDLNRYHLWYGIYLLPLNCIYEIRGGLKSKIDIFGYDVVKNKINIDEVFLIIQYDYYNYFRFSQNKFFKNNPEVFLKKYKFENLNLKAKESNYCNYCWELEGSVYGKNLMNKTKNPLHSFLQAMTIGWIPKNNEQIHGHSKYKGRMVIAYRDKEGNIVNPSSKDANILSCGYVFGIHWDNNKKETPNYIIEELASDFAKIKYKIINKKSAKSFL